MNRQNSNKFFVRFKFIYIYNSQLWNTKCYFLFEQFSPKSTLENTYEYSWYKCSN